MTWVDFFYNVNYGNTGCGVFKRGWGTKLEGFLHKNQLIKGNYGVLDLWRASLI